MYTLEGTILMKVGEEICLDDISDKFLTVGHRYKSQGTIVMGQNDFVWYNEHF